MEEANESDSITFFALRQIGCNIPEDCKNIGQFNVDILLEVVDKCLGLISGGTMKLPLPLPKNIATRHRVCTDVASKIKSLGYIGDCGYNQLLYPVEGQTRTMLLWLVQKLPRVEEEREVDVGSSARFNRRIHDRLAAWKETTWKLPFCSTGEGPLSKNIYSRRALYTLDTHGPAIQIIRESSQAGKAFESSLLEKHSLLLAKEGLLSSTTQDFELASDELDSLSLNGGVDDPRTKLKNALKSAKTEHMAAYGGSSSGNGGRGRTNTVDSRSLNNQSGAVSAADLYGKSFNELIAAIKDNATDTTTSIVPATDGSSSDASMLVGTVGGRFQQATKFAQESEGLSINEGVLTSLALGTSVTSVDSAPVDVVNSSDVPVVVSTDQSTEDTAAAEEAAIIALAEELEGMRATLQTRLQQYIEAEDEESSRPARIIQFQNEVKELQARCDEMEKEIMIKKQTLELLPKAADNVRALTAECDEQSKHLSSLADEWEVHRAPLLERLNALQLLKSQRRQRCKEMIEDIKRYKEEIAGMAPELREKQAKSVALQEERAKLNQDVSRSIYTEKILMVTRNLAKHNAEVEKVCGDIRELQRDIGRTTEALQRADAVAEEFTFAAANKSQSGGDKSLIEAYKKLQELRSNFEKLFAAIDRLSQNEKLSHDLETKIDQEKSRVSTNNIAQISTDIAAVKGENATLIEQIKKVSVATK